MKNMKKLAALLLALLLVLTMTAAYAEETKTETETGSITINGVSETSKYEVYRLLDLESYNSATGAYSYKVNAAWKGFFETEEALKYVAIDDSGYVTWKESEVDSVVAAFAKKALAYAQDNKIAPVQSSTNAGQFVITEKTGVFSGLPLGYYLVDSTVGALCGLTTTNPAASINAKNSVPTIDKQVQEDSTSQWADSNSADIGQIVNFRTTINVHAGAQNYVLHDHMSAGLTFDPKTVVVKHLTPGSEETKVNVENYTVVEVKNKDDGYCDKDTCTFEVRFTNAYCDSLETNDKLIIYYSAMLNRNALIAGTGNTNGAVLEFGEGNVTTEDQTQTYSFGIDIVKTDSQNTLLDGAVFKIYDAPEGGNEVKVTLMDDKVTYRRARTDEPGEEIVVEGGKVRVVGFDNGTYYLEEITAPDGYNKLSARQKFIISDANLDAIFNDKIFSTGSGVHVVNKTGSMLPETGGIGTTLFYVIGGVLAVAAVVLLVTKKRMNGMD